MCDNRSTIALIKNLIFHGRSKHINIKFHFTNELVKNDEIELKFCKLENQVVDIFTKPLERDVFKKLKMMLCVIYFTTQLKRGY